MVRGAVGTFGHRKASDSAKMLYEASVEELDTRSMQIQTPHSSQHTTDGSHGQKSLSSSACRGGDHFSARARMGSRSGSVVAVDTSSTTVSSSVDGVTRWCGELEDLDGLQPPHRTNGCRLILSPGTASCSTVCSFSFRTLTVARARASRVPLSRSRWQRSKGASRRLLSDKSTRDEKRCRKKSSRQTR